MEQIDEKIELLYENFLSRFKFFRQFIAVLRWFVKDNTLRMKYMVEAIEELQEDRDSMAKRIESLEEYIESLPAPRRDPQNQPLTAASVMEKQWKAIAQPDE